MADSELQPGLQCPRCGTPNLPSVQRCRQCFQHLEQAAVPAARSGPLKGVFDFHRTTVDCSSCGRANPSSRAECRECGASLASTPELPPFEAPAHTERLRRAVRSRRQQDGAVVKPSWVNLAWFLRLAAVLFLLWGVIDTSFWLDRVTRDVTAADATVTRYSTFAIYELVRDFCIASSIWLLTCLRPRR